ncbi:MAG: SDR family oxidoreductase [Phycisphaeraceae bacterium]|nr:SDR family oxidoreductase [Phycisphaeraceae bacterium]
MSSSQRVVIVTGGASGIGHACVEAFLHDGARVVIADVDPSGVSLAKRLDERRCLFVQTDVSSPAQVENLMRQTISTFGRLDVLVSNAAVLLPTATVQDTTLEQLDRLLSVNVKGSFLCCQAAYPHLRDSRGCVVHVSSMAGVHGEKAHAAYAATKGAINALTQSLAIDWASDGIRCNAVCPSTIETENAARSIAAMPDAEKIQRLRSRISALGEVGTPAQVARVVVFLASDAASYITGTLLPVSGGSECGYGVKY